MSLPPPLRRAETTTAYYRTADAMRSRSVSAVVLTGTLDVPAPSHRLLADWQRETSVHMGLEPGDVQPLPLARARMRWPDYRHCVQAVADWTRAQGLQDLLVASEVALMASRGARYHHDGAQYGAAAFCNLFLSEDQGLDVHFPASGQRIPLVRGTVMVFDTGQPHALVPRGHSDFDAADFCGAAQERCQVFLTWELPIEDVALAQALSLAFDTDPATAATLTQEQVWQGGAPGSVCPQSGRWLA